MRFPLSMRSLADYKAQPQNNYLLLRFVAALMVIYSHSYSLTHPGEGDILRRTLRFTDFGDLGVDIFFVISGFLVTASYLNRADFADYLKCRILRIAPGLAVCLMLTAFVLGPLVSSLAPAAYFSFHLPYSYVVINLSMLEAHYTLPGVFHDVPFRDSVNGSLWTLPVEFRLYLLIGLVGALGLLGRRRWYLWIVLALAVGTQLLTVHARWLTIDVHVRHLCLYFLAGSAMRVYAERIPLSGILLAALAALSLALYWTPGFQYLLGATLAYGILWMAYVPNLHWFNRLGDYSYGLYIYAFPIGQTLRQYFEHIGPLQMFAACSVVTLACAVLSWHLVEQPALRLKRVRFRESLWRWLRGRPAT